MSESTSSPDFLRLVLDTTPSLIFVKDYDGRFVLANQATADIYGTSVEMLVGKTDADFNPDSLQVAQFREADRQVISSGTPKFIPEEPVRDSRTGRTRWFQTYKVPLRSTSGQVTQLLGVSTDITDRKQAEEDLRDAQNQLLQAQKMESIGRFAGGIAHDFNNLLTVITGSCEQLLDDMNSKNLNSQALHRIASATEHAVALVKQLLAFSRKQILQPEVIDLNEIVRTTQPLLARLLDERIEVVTLLDDKPAWVKADSTQIQQVLMNLAVNAKDAMPGSGRLTIVVKSGKFGSAGSILPIPTVTLTVSDSGCGMSCETKARVFDPFFTTKAPGKGTGLGLSTVHGIIAQSEGKIEVKSEVGLGTTFTITLPGTASPEASRSSDPLVATLKQKATILVVEDQTSVREVVCLTLRSLDYRVLEAQDVNEAFAIWCAHKKDVRLILSDVVMPGGNGPVLLERLPAEDRPLFLYMSGYTEDAMIKDGVFGAGVNFIQKPFSAADLDRKIISILIDPS